MPTHTPVLPDGDWFVIQPYSSKVRGSQLFMSRVVLWLVADWPDDPDARVVLTAVTGSGLAAREAGAAEHFVCGRDACPDNRSWSEVYAAASKRNGRRHSQREITDQAAGWPE